MELKGGYKMTPVFYRGSAPAINDLLAGTIDMVPDYLLANKGNIDAGKIKMIAVADHQAAEGISQRADHGGDHAGRHLDHLDGGVGAARHAEGDHPEDLRRDRARASSSPTCRRASSSSRPTPLGTTPERMREMIKESDGHLGAGGEGGEYLDRLSCAVTVPAADAQANPPQCAMTLRMSFSRPSMKA